MYKCVKMLNRLASSITNTLNSISSPNNSIPIEAPALEIEDEEEIGLVSIISKDQLLKV